MFDFIRKWLSRKALYPVVFALLVMLNNSVLHNLLTEDQINDLANLVLAFIVGEASIDAVRVYIESKTQAKQQ